MKERKPLILVSNDDGYLAKGINELIKYIRPLGHLVVMAPDSARSGMSCAITAGHPVSYQLVRQEPELSIYKCTGTPVDCIKLALFDLLYCKPDVIIGGINHGDNSALNVHYSGTMGIVIEGCLKGIPSIGFSLCNHDSNADFSPAAAYIRRITEMVLKKGLPQEICLNVNFPDAEKYKGVKICRQTKGSWEHEWEKREHPHKGEYFWLTGDFENTETGSEDTDQWALANDYAAITPVKIDVTAYEIINELKTWTLDK